MWWARFIIAFAGAAAVAPVFAGVVVVVVMLAGAAAAGVLFFFKCMFCMSAFNAQHTPAQHSLDT